MSLLSQFEREIQILENFRISSIEGTEKVLNFSDDEVLNFFRMDWKSTVKLLIFGQPVLVDTL